MAFEEHHKPVLMDAFMNCDQTVVGLNGRDVWHMAEWKDVWLNGRKIPQSDFQGMEGRDGRGWSDAHLPGPAVEWNT